jgi:hypothetical protein
VKILNNLPDEMNNHGLHRMVGEDITAIIGDEEIAKIHLLAIL